jgi:hypothetical protein
MAYDPATGQTVLFGGITCDSNVTFLADTWIWDGTNWNQVTPANSPPAHAFSAMAFDPSTQRLTLFGGVDANAANVQSATNDSWEWDGSNWQQLSPAQSPGNLLWASVTEYPPGAGVLVFGGQQDNPGRDVSDTWILGPPPVQLVSVVSRKMHGTVGTFDVDLTSGDAIECRSGGTVGNYILVFRFANPLTAVGGAHVTSGTGSVESSNIDNSDAHNYIVNLTGVANAQYLSVALSSVADSAGDVSAAVPVTLGLLIGDVNASGRVDAADVSLVRQETLQPITSANFREDVNTSGRIDAADVSIVRQQTLTSLP